jgi:hypothetical protein
VSTAEIVALVVVALAVGVLVGPFVMFGGLEFAGWLSDLRLERQHRKQAEKAGEP